jgi:hypothetical protein
VDNLWICILAHEIGHFYLHNWFNEFGFESRFYDSLVTMHVRTHDILIVLRCFAEVVHAALVLEDRWVVGFLHAL